MYLTTTAANETVEALAARVYDLGDKPTQAAARAAAKAVTDANPFLRRIDEVPAGTVVAVPPIEKGEVRRDATEGPEAMAAALVADRVRAGAVLAQRQLLADAEAEIEDAKSTVRLARSAELRKVRGQAPEVREALSRTIEAAQARADAATDLREHQRAVFRQIAEDLDELTSMFDTKEQAP